MYASSSSYDRCSSCMLTVSRLITTGFAPASISRANSSSVLQANSSSETLLSISSSKTTEVYLLAVINLAI